jgi:hypothetical protein
MAIKLSDATAHKLHAALYHEWPSSDEVFLPEYRKALQSWFAALSPSDQTVAVVAREAYDRGNDVEAKKAAAALPPVPVCPLLL